MAGLSPGAEFCYTGGMSTIPPRFMQELRDRLSLSDVIGRSVKLARAGREFKACCPFHHEKSPSFYVNDDKQFYHCFGCGAHGDAVGFLMQHDKMSFIEAVEALAAQAGMQVPKATPQEVERARHEKDLYTLMDEAARWFEAALYNPKHGDALLYLTGRGMGEETLRAFRIGYAPADGAALPEHLRRAGYSEAQMIEAGLVRRSNKGSGVYSFFRDRIIFPVADRRGRVVAFGGRVLPEHLRPLVPGEGKPPKYINSSETPLFHKGRMLYGEAHARQAAADGQKIIVVEGYVDAIAAFTAGYRGAVAPLGTALTADQVSVLWKMIPGPDKVPVLCFDGDDAGRRAALRACGVILPLLRPDHSVRLAFLPDGQDPDSMIRGQGKPAFDAVIDSAINLADFLWLHHSASKRPDTPEGRAGLLQALEEDAQRIQDRDVQHFYVRDFRDRVRNAFSSPIQRGKGGGTGGKPRPVAGRGSPPLGMVGPGIVGLRRPAYAANRMRVMILLAVLVNHPVLFPEVEDELLRLDIPDSDLSAFRQALLVALEGGGDMESTPMPEAVKAALRAAGQGEMLEIIDSGAIFTHAGFARPDSGLEIARKGWHDTVALMGRHSVHSEIRAIGRDLATDFTEENERRIMALHRSDRAGQSED